MGAAVIMVKERHIVEAMQRLAVTSPARALTVDQLADLGVDDRGLAWRALKRRVIVREASPGKWYVDGEVWQTTRRRRHILLFVLVITALTSAVILLSANRIAP